MGDSRFIQSEFAWGKAFIDRLRLAVKPVLYLALNLIPAALEQ